MRHRPACAPLTWASAIASLASLVSRALPWASGLPGVAPTTEQKELDEVMKELEGPTPPPKPSR